MEETAKYYKNKELVDEPMVLESAFDVPTIGADFTERLEWTLMYLSFKNSMMGMFENQRPFHFKEFDGAWLISQDRLGKTEKDNLCFLHPNDAQATPEIFPEMHIKTLSIKHDNDSATGMESFKLIPQKEKRHLPQYRNIMRKRTAFLTNKEKWYMNESYYHLDQRIENYTLIEKEYGAEIYDMLKVLLKGKYFPIQISFDPNYAIHERAYLRHYFNDEKEPVMAIKGLIDLVNRVNFAFNIKLSAYYEWFVYIRESDNSIGFKVPINPSASKEIFQLRDIPEGKSRRSAICNFVREHMRTLRTNEMTNEEIQTTVKKHMRGETKFNWRGLQVNVIPSEYDIKRVGSKKKKYLEV